MPAREAAPTCRRGTQSARCGPMQTVGWGRRWEQESLLRPYPAVLVALLDAIPYGRRERHGHDQERVLPQGVGRMARAQAIDGALEHQRTQQGHAAAADHEDDAKRQSA